MFGWARLRRRFLGGRDPLDGHGSPREHAPPEGRGPLLARGAREHRWFLGLLAAGAALRLVTVLGYRPALWFPDSYTYVVTAMRPRPDLVRPAGYSMFLRLLQPFHDFAVVTVAQHLIGLLVGVLVYLTARRLRAPGWAATLASAPSLLDAYQIELEHLLVSDTLFTVLVVAAACLAVRGLTPGGPGSRTGWRTAAGIGLLLAAATLTRTVGLPLVALFACWLILRERGRVRAAGIMLIAATVPILGYGAWFHATTQRIGIVGANGVFLYAKTMTFADCGVMRPPPDLAVLCDPRPPALRPPAQEYVWSQESPLVRLPGITFTRESDALAGRFASLAIRSQPLDYLGSVASELSRSFTVGRPVYPDQEIYDYYRFPATPPPPPGRYPATVGAQAAERYQRGPISTRIVEPYAGWMRTYQGVAGLPGAAVLVILLLPPAAACVRRFRSASTAWALPWSVAAVLLVMPPAVAEFDYRYVLPAVPAACLAAALIVRKPNFSNIPLNVRI
ncbi:phospholipid carrier-dependent glycosyltransferase [Streptosporangium sp. NPDC023615]|uniref:phospholipid carrier-dependent glycosyltransferase n=1 Tax=Streptosporangium sp. NPDC023615 TaxID=3154794 RepID=UPI00341E8141